MTSVTIRPICPAPKIAAACDNCRSRKVRCLPSKTPGTCERCALTQSNCASIRVRGVGGRKRVAKSAAEASRLEKGELNSTSGNLVSLLLSSVSDTKRAEDSHFPSFTEHHRSMLDRHFPEPFAPPSPPTPLGNEAREKIHSCRGRECEDLSTTESENYLIKFRNSCDHFPFVCLPENLDLASALRLRPFLTFGILSVMSNDRPSIQRSLDTEFRRAVNEKVIVNSENSLDILQGLLVYLAWFPLQINPRKGRLYQILGTAANMVKDLGYDSPPDPSISAPEDEHQEMKRAYLGCFCLCTNFSIPRTRPSLMYWTPYLDSCLSEISAISNSDSSSVAVVLTKLHLIEFETWGTLQSTRGSSNLRVRLNTLSNTFPNQLRHKLNIQLLEQFVAIRISVTSRLNLHQDNSPEDLTHSTQAIKSFLEHFAHFDLTQYQNFSMMEWNLLIRTIISIFELLTSSLHQSSLDSTNIQEICSFAPALENVRFRVQQYSKHPTDIFGLFYSVLQVIEEKYGRMCAQFAALGGKITSQWSQYKYMASLCPVVNGSLRNTPHGAKLGEDFSVFENLLQDIDWDSPISAS